DNLTTKSDLTFAEVKQRLIDLDYEESTETAFSTAVKGFKKPRPMKPAISQKKSCSFCKKHHPTQASGHTWFKCPKIKERNIQKANQLMASTDEAHMTLVGPINEKVSQRHFNLDTCATAHMCPYPERFECISDCSGLVTSSSGQNMKVLGRGTVVLNCMLSNKTVSQFKLSNVLYVPGLQHSLFSWRQERHKGYTLVDDGNVMKLIEHNITYLEATFNGPLPLISESAPKVQDYACLTYDFWHDALCRAAPSSISNSLKIIQNPNVIPERPESFHCKACALSKSTHSKCEGYNPGAKLGLVALVYASRLSEG
ncbi:hypothetical protein K3495_g15614, partial [Podosphaera aphanis]